MRRQSKDSRARPGRRGARNAAKSQRTPPRPILGSDQSRDRLPGVGRGPFGFRSFPDPLVGPRAHSNSRAHPQRRGRCRPQTVTAWTQDAREPQAWGRPTSSRCPRGQRPPKNTVTGLLARGCEPRLAVPTVGGPRLPRSPVHLPSYSLHWQVLAEHHCVLFGGGACVKSMFSRWGTDMVEMSATGKRVSPHRGPL